MTVTAVDHVEFYVGDATKVAQILCDAFGFRCQGQGGPETGLGGQRTLLLGQRDIRLLVTSALTADHPVAHYVDRHGDGVACVGLRTEDAASAFASAVGAGARAVTEPTVWRRGDASVTTATVSGPGALTHRLVERRQDPAAGAFLPGGIDPLTPDPEPGDQLLREIDHLALCVPAGALEPTVEFYRDAFGLAEIFQERVEVGDQAMDSKVVQSLSRQVTCTIVSPDPVAGSGQLEDFLLANEGAGMQHVALSTQDIPTAVGRCRERGVRFLTTPESYYDDIEQRLGEVSLPIAALRQGGILVDRDHYGEMFQIFTESPFERRTFFFELIERHGALTFGANNIRALYEAKERARAAAAAAAADSRA
jgi:4-hydroxymandelate synthase